MEFFSRNTELKAVLGVVRASAGEALALVGEHGSGKTAILNAAASSVDSHVAIVRGNPIETCWPLAGVTAFLAAIDDAQGTDFLSVFYRAKPRESSFELAQEIVLLLRDANLNSLLVLIDDADLLDEPSQQVLGYVIRRMAATGMRTVLTVACVTPDCPFAGIPRLVLRLLDVATLIELGRSLAPPSTSYVVLDCVARASAGSPMAFKSILGELPMSVLEGATPLPVPMRPGKKLAALTSDFLDELGVETRRSLDLLVCGPYIPESVFRLLDDASLEGLEELIAKDFVERQGEYLVVKDSAAYSTGLWALSSTARLKLHEQLADVCKETRPGLYAWHASFLQVSGEHSAELLATAALSVERGVIRVGIEFAERALALSDGADVAQDFVPLVRSLILTAEYDLARRYLRFARGTVHPEKLPLEFVVFMGLLDFAQHQVVSVPSSMAALAKRPKTDSGGSARVLCIVALGLLERWELPEAREVLGQAISLTGAGAESVAGASEVLRLHALAFEGRPLPAPRELEPLLHVIEVAFGREISRILVARALTLGERYADARGVLNRVFDEVTGVPRFWIDGARQAQWFNECRAGNYQRARGVFEVIEASGGMRRSFKVNRGLMSATLASLDGDAKRANEIVRETAQLVTPGQSPAQEALIAVRQARIAMMTRDHEGASFYFARARKVGADLMNPQFLRFHGDYIDTLLALGHRELATELFQELEVAAGNTPSNWAALTLRRCEAKLLDGEESLQAFAELVESWIDGNYEYLRARTLFSYADKLQELGHGRRSMEARREALSIFQEIGVSSKIEPCHDEQPASAGSPLLELLDGKELPVVRLLSKGYKNQSIAHELFISVRTVELRLTNVYRKCGVKSRFELMKLIAGQLDEE